MATSILPEVNSAAKRVIYDRLEDAFDSVDRACNRIGALSKAIRAVLSCDADSPDIRLPKAQKDVAKELADQVDDVAKYMWACVDGHHSELRDTLGVKTADYESEVAHG